MIIVDVISFIVSVVVFYHINDKMAAICVSLDVRKVSEKLFYVSQCI